MKLPKKSTWHIIRGTWFVYSGADYMVHIHWKSNGWLLIYIDGKLVDKTRSFKPRINRTIDHENTKVEIRIYPQNKAMTSFATDVVIDELLVRTFTLKHKRQLKQYLPYIGVIVVLTVVMVLLKLPDWSLYVMVFSVLAIKYFFFNKHMFSIEEADNSINLDI